MDIRENIDVGLMNTDEPEEKIIDYCDECDEPILEGDVYEITNDGRVLCEACYITMFGG